MEIAWHPASDNNWVSYYDVLRDGVAVAKVAIGTYFFDYGRSAAGLMGSRYAVRTVDGDGNRSAVVEAGQTAGDAGARWIQPGARGRAMAVPGGLRGRPVS